MQSCTFSDDVDRTGAPRLRTLLDRVRRQNLFTNGETVIVAVSGGADSVALLDILHSLPEERLQLVVAHLNHGLRGEESDGDENFVASLAKQYGLPFVSRQSDVAALATTLRLSLEDAGRRARYAFLTDTAQSYGATSIAVAHHLDDQAETVLMRLLRGAGGSGLSAMASVSAGMVKRPLLPVSRQELEQYLKDRGLTWRTDSTNADTAILRNSIRHELIPMLRRYNPQVSHRLAATAEILSLDEELLEQMTAAAYDRLASREGSNVVLDARTLATEPKGLRLRLYRRALSELRGDLQRIALNHLHSIDDLINGERPSAKLKLPGDCFVQRSYDRVSFSPGPHAAAAPWEIAITGEGRYPLPDGRTVSVQQGTCPESLQSSPSLAYFDPQMVSFPWLLRSYRPGDRFRPLGMGGSQKIKALFINEKIPLCDRCRIPVLISSERIVWVVGVRLGEEARLKPATRAALRVEILDFTP
jgi:tRNA(Ile)-lysidine synthase